MRFRNCLAVLFLCLVAPLWAKPPATKTVSQSDTYHGTEVSDPYRWLEDAQSPEVKAWIKAQNAYTESQLGSFAEGKAISHRVGQLALTSSRQFSPQILGGRLFYMRETPPQPQAVLVAADWPNGEPRVLVDTNKGDASAILDFWPSPSGRYVAYGTATGGSELVTLKVVDTAQAKELPDRLPHAAGGTTPPGVLWDADEKGFVYVRLPLPDQVDESRLMFDASLYHHTLGESSTEDEPAFGQGLSPVAEYRLTSSDDGKAAAVIVWFGDGSPERVYLRGPQGYKLVLGPEADVRSGGRWDGHRLLVVAHGNTPRGRVLAVEPDGQVETVVPEGDWAAQGVAPIGDGYLVTRVWGSQWRIDHHDRKGNLVRSVDLPAETSVRAIASASDSKSALISYQGWTNPDTWVVYDGPSGKLDTIFKVEPAADYS
ncbi:MAG: S9 family peptidase, partial [Candidatus Eremiobacteraeota bacterium]|nr:S9 family peptidase [Candidatus Eremiobacteraeota bacterium]